MFNFLRRKTQYKNWNAYKSTIDFLEEFRWQQSVRQENLRR